MKASGTERCGPLLVKYKTLRALGLRNVARVAGYRLALKAHLHPAINITAEVPRGPFVDPDPQRMDLPATDAWTTTGKLFGWRDIPVSASPPDWFQNFITDDHHGPTGLPWWKIDDFGSPAGDIKGVWELSRFEWVAAMAQRVAVGQDAERTRLEDWLQDWCDRNPPYQGVHWKCGQEAALRVLHLSMAVLWCSDRSLTDGMADLLQVHLKRIQPTLSYAVSQDNNHGTSEAAALVVGGALLLRRHANDRKAAAWLSLGRRWLEERIQRLIRPDGSFSQHSVTYHRLMLDTISVVEIWRRRLNLTMWSNLSTKRMAAASEWLQALVDPINGNAPNIGANDSACLFMGTDAERRDFRVSVQVASALFRNTTAYSQPGPWHNAMKWFDLSPPKIPIASQPATDRLFDEGGYVILKRKRKRAMAVMRYPRFRFRPSHADALHVDFWYQGENVLRDAGTYRYNTDRRWLDYFPGTGAHNTIQFDDRDQMPRLGRFLFGDWLSASETSPLATESNASTFSCAYCDRWQAKHHRKLCLSDRSLTVEDTVSGFNSHAVLRWRLMPGKWQCEEGQIVSSRFRMTIQADVSIKRFELTQGWESMNYHHKRKIPVVEVEIKQAGKFSTELRWDEGGKS